MEPPPGWSSMRELNAAVMEASQARNRTPQSANQSLRNGSQTRVTWWSMRIRPSKVLHSFSEPLQMYLREIAAILSTRHLA